MARWRVGRTLGRTLYVGDKCIGMVDTPAIAEDIVDRMNAADERHQVAVVNAGAEPPDRNLTRLEALESTRIKPHTIKGYLQVWSGHLCVRLIDEYEAEALRQWFATPHPAGASEAPPRPAK
jgi:hypothetical protein